MRTQAWWGWVLLGAVVAICVATSVGAYMLATFSWNAVVDYDSPYARFEFPPAGAGSKIASTTVVVIVDGLNDETSRKLDGLERLREYGTDLTLVAPQPTLSFPNWTTILSGAPPYVSGVTSNDWNRKVPVETLIDTALRVSATTVVVGPEELQTLYGASRSTASFLRSYPETFYASTTLVDEAITLIDRVKPRLAIVHLPDVDNAGHRSGSASEDYLATARKVDIDIDRLVQATQTEGTTFVIVSDHGHTEAGGHGGWESTVANVPGLFFGKGMHLAQSQAKQEDVAPTVAVIAGVPVPRFSKGDVLDVVVGNSTSERLRPAWNQRLLFATAYVRTVLEPTGTRLKTEFASYAHGATVTRAMDNADEMRLDYDRLLRRPWGLAVAAIALIALVVVGVASWRALVGALAGTVAYYLVYNGLFFVVHGYQWSLSSFGDEKYVNSFLYTRMAEAVLAGLIGAGVAALTYILLRQRPQGPWGVFRPRWFLLGPVTVLVILSTLSAQVAWYVWAWGVVPTWILPDLKWGVKYDLDLIQATALGVVALLSPLVTYLVGRYHPRTRLASTDPRFKEPPIASSPTVAVPPIAEE